MYDVSEKRSSTSKLESFSGIKDLSIHVKQTDLVTTLADEVNFIYNNFRAFYFIVNSIAFLL